MNCKAEYKRYLHRRPIQEFLAEWDRCERINREDDRWEDVCIDLREVAQERGITTEKRSA